MCVADDILYPVCVFFPPKIPFQCPCPHPPSFPLDLMHTLNIQTTPYIGLPDCMSVEVEIHALDVLLAYCTLVGFTFAARVSSVILRTCLGTSPPMYLLGGSVKSAEVTVRPLIPSVYCTPAGS